MVWRAFDPEQRWRAVDEDARVARRQWKRWQAECYVRELLKGEAVWLLEGTTPPDDANEIIKRLLVEVEDDADAEVARLRRNFLIRGVDAGNRDGRWHLKVPPQTLRVPLPKPAITDKNFQDISRFERIRRSFLLAIEDKSFPSLTGVLSLRRFGHATERLTERDLQAGAALLAAVLFGGLIGKSRLLAIAAAMPDQLRVWQRHAWIEWPDNLEQGECKGMWHRWYADPISGLLLCRAHRNGMFPLIRPTSNVTRSAAVWKRLDAVLSQLPVAREDMPSSLTGFLEMAKAWSYFNLPPFLAAYACERVLSVSPPPSAHLRVMTGMPMDSLASSNVMETEPRPTADLKFENRVSHGQGLGDTAAMIRELRATLKRKGGKAEARKALNRFLLQGDLPPSIVRLAEWLCDLVSSHAVRGTQLRLSTIYTYLTRIDRPLITILEGQDPACFTGQEFNAVYREVLSAIKPSHKANAIFPLSLFHSYLLRSHGVPEDIGDVFDGIKNDGSIDANLITPKEYRSALALLESSAMGISRELARMQKIALMLGYRGHLRRGEVRRLRIGDVCGAVFGTIYIRSTEKGNVKSASGIRKLSQKALFQQDELEELRAFVLDRLRLLIGQNDFKGAFSPFDENIRRVWRRPLFEHPGKPGELYPEKSLFDRISTAIQEVTQDRTAHFHMLRKGGQNAVFLALLEEELPGCSEIFGTDEAMRRFSEEMGCELLGTNGPDRRRLWAASSLAGHASPSTTAGSYQHLFAWLLYCAVLRHMPKLRTALVATIIGISDNHLRVVRSQKRVAEEDWLFWASYRNNDWLRSVTPQEATIKKTPVVMHLLHENIDEQPLLPGTDAIAMLYQAIKGSKPLHALARKNGVSVEMVEAWVQAARQLASLIGISPAKKPLHRITPANTSEVRLDGLVIRRKVPLPVPIKQRDERERVNRLTVMLYRTVRRDCSLALKWLDLYWRRRQPKRHEVAFNDVEEAKWFLSKLREIFDGEPMAVRFLLYPLSCRDAPSIEEQRNRWAEELGIDPKEIGMDRSKVRQMNGQCIGTIAFHLPIPISPTQKHWQKTRSGALDAACYISTVMLLADGY